MNPLSKLSLLSVLTFPLLAQEPPQPPVEKPKEQVEAPKVLQLGQRVNGLTTLPDLDGTPVLARDLMGKLVVVNFYSIQCPVQRAWDQRLAAIQQDFAAKGVVFLHIDSNVTEIGEQPPKVEGDEKPYAKVREHLAAQKLPFRVLVDHGNKVADLFDARTTPHVYVFGTDGRLVYKGLVDDDQKDRNADARNNYVRDVLGKLLAAEKVEPFATKEQGCSIKRVGAKAKGSGGKGSGV
jgi:peroxiredoxin